MEKMSVPSINLAKNRGEHFIDRFFTWALSIGRVLVIFTEAIALGAFLYRFGLDRQILDLHDRITQEEAVVNLLKSNEATYRNVQDRLTLAKNIDTQSAYELKTYQDISNMVPSDMDIQNIYYTTDTMHVDGSVGSIVNLSSFVKKLKAYEGVDKVSIDKLESKSSTGEYSIAVTVFFTVSKQKSLL